MGDNFSNSPYGEHQYQDSYYSDAMSYGQTEELATNTMAKSFLVMVVALLVTAVTAYMTVSNVGMFVAVYSNFTLFLILELVAVFATSFAIRKNKTVLSAILFAAYCIINGMTLSFIFIAYEIGSIREIAVLAAVVFGVMAAYGMITKRDLTSWGSIGIMALLGMIIVSLFNVFFQSSGLDMIMNYIGVLVFVGLTAYDVQRLKNHSLEISTSNANTFAIFFAMELYLDLINLFLRLLAIFGRSRD